MAAFAVARGAAWGPCGARRRRLKPGAQVGAGRRAAQPILYVDGYL